MKTLNIIGALVILVCAIIVTLLGEKHPTVLFLWIVGIIWLITAIRKFKKGETKTK